MPSPKNHNFLVGVLDRHIQLGHLTTLEMKIGKAPELLKKAAAVCKSKTSVLAARFLVFLKR